MDIYFATMMAGFAVLGALMARILVELKKLNRGNSRSSMERWTTRR
jgi:hypothetical protein